MDGPSRRRVKVYQLNNDGQWDDKGTGHVSCLYLEKLEGICLLVTSEIDNSTLLETKILSGDIYQRQQETLIVWNEPETSDDLALSFQESEGCDEIWLQIQQVQKGLNNNCDSPKDDGQYESALQLPATTLENLDAIHQIVTTAINSPSEKETLSIAIIHQNYIRNLLDLFHEVEKTNEIQSLRKMFDIFKSLVLLNHINVIETLFDEENVLDVMGALEYDPELPTSLHHREFLKTKAIFKEVIPFNDKEVVKKIHQTFRIQYLRDTVLPRVLDDITYGTLNSLIYFNQIEIITTLQKDTKFLTELFSKIQTEKDYENLKELGRFLQELCSLAKNLQVPQRMVFFSTLSSRGLFNVLEILLSNHGDTTNALRMSGLEIINSILNHDGSMLRKFILSQKPKYGLMEKLLYLLTSETESGLTGQVAEILRSLLDTELMTDLTEKNDFLTMFYQSDDKSFIEQLTHVLDQKDNPSKNLVCELLGYCVQHHNYRIKHYILGHNLSAKISKLIQHKEKHIALSALRFVRAIVGMKDEAYNKHLIKTKMLDSVMDAFNKNGSRYNLLNSSIIEIFEFIRKENIKSLINNIVEKYESIFRSITYVETFQRLVDKYEQNKERSSSISDLSEQSNNNKRLADSDDDSYFKESDDEEVNGDTPLVPYEDNEDSKKENVVSNSETSSATTQSTSENHTENKKGTESDTEKGNEDGRQKVNGENDDNGRKGGKSLLSERTSDEEGDVNDRQPKRLKVG